MGKSSTPSYVIKLKLNTNTHHDHVLAKRFYYGQQIYNVLARHARKQIFNMQSDKEYQRLISQYVELKGGKPDVKKARAEIGKELSKIRLYYGLSEYQFHSYVTKSQYRYKKHIDSHVAQKIASAVWKATEKVIFDNGKRVHFRKYDDFLSMEGKNNVTGIRYVDGKFLWGKLEISVQHDKKDLYQQIGLQSRVKYCRIKRQVLGAKYHYYLELIIEGIPPIKHVIGVGEVGIDIGTSTIAVVSKEHCILDELAKDVISIEKEKRILQRKMNRSRRTTNPDNYNVNGTVKKNCKWVKSNSYRKLNIKHKALCHKRAAIMKQSHEILANEILELGDIIRVERMSFSGLAKKSKNQKRGKSGKYKSRKRFGKSIQNRAPSMLLSIIDRKLKYHNQKLIKVDTVKFRASQYNHVTDDYVKKKLNHRYTMIDNNKIQRDLYSAFLIMNSNDKNTASDRDKCLETFNNFKILHNICINSLLTQNHKYPSSMGLKYFCNC